MSPEFEMLMKHLRDRTADVELDLPVPSGASDLSVATELARSRRVAINRGDRASRMSTSSSMDSERGTPMETKQDQSSSQFPLFTTSVPDPVTHRRRLSLLLPSLAYME
jgi:hypothetical protein